MCPAAPATGATFVRQSHSQHKPFTIGLGSVFLVLRPVAFARNLPGSKRLTSDTLRFCRTQPAHDHPTANVAAKRLPRLACGRCMQVLRPRRRRRRSALGASGEKSLRGDNSSGRQTSARWLQTGVSAPRLAPQAKRHTSCRGRVVVLVCCLRHPCWVVHGLDSRQPFKSSHESKLTACVGRTGCRGKYQVPWVMIRSDSGAAWPWSLRFFVPAVPRRRCPRQPVFESSKRRNTELSQHGVGSCGAAQ